MTDFTPGHGATGAALVALASTIVGHQFGPLATVVFCGLVGAVISLAEVVTNGYVDGLKYVGRYVGMAVAIAFGLSYLINRFTAIPAVEVLGLVAFCVGWVGNRWSAILDALLSGAKAIINRKGSGS